ncbi:MAG: hypothetical protein GY945_06685 [Rhodobacteraceae bacterium]|nr:hypothetical protein [Paracoccaceae bacterium]
MQKFQFKPALLASKKTYHLKGDALTQVKNGKAVWTLPLADVEKAGLVDQTIKGARMTRLDLYVAGKNHSIAQNQSALAWQENPDVVSFLGLIRALGRALGESRPDLMVSLGEYGRFRIWMFAAGLLSAISGVALFGAALATGVGNNALISTTVPVIILLALGVMTSRAYWPWTKLPSIPATELEKVVEFLRTNNG